MVGAVVAKLSPSESTTTVEISNSSISNDSSTDEYKVMVAATVTVLSGIIQVSVFSCNRPSPGCLSSLVHIFLFCLLPATPPPLPLAFIPFSVARGKGEGPLPPTRSEGAGPHCKDE